MYRIGYIDDDTKQYNNYSKKISRRFDDIELVLIDGCSEKLDFIEKIYKERIDVLLIDYKMANTFGFNGTTLLTFINERICDLECFILTAVEKDQVDDGLVADRNVFSKTIFDTEGDDEVKVKYFNDFIDTLKKSASVFKKRQEINIQRYKELIKKKKFNSLGADEEEFINLYKVLSSYGKVEKLPEEFLKTEFCKQMDKLLLAGNSILDKYSQDNKGR